MLYLSQRTQDIVNRVLQIVVLGYQAVAVLVFVFSLYLANGWLKNPCPEWFKYERRWKKLGNV